MALIHLYDYHTIGIFLGVLINTRRPIITDIIIVGYHRLFQSQGYNFSGIGAGLGPVGIVIARHPAEIVVPPFHVPVAIVDGTDRPLRVPTQAIIIGGIVTHFRIRHPCVPHIPRWVPVFFLIFSRMLQTLMMRRRHGLACVCTRIQYKQAGKQGECLCCAWY